MSVSLFAEALSEPSSIIGLAGVALVTVSGWVTLLIQQRGNATKIDDMHSEVKNAHGSNLRDDLDVVRDLVIETRTGVRALRREIDREREVRADLQRRFDESPCAAPGRHSRTI